MLHARQGTKEIVEVGFSALRAHTIVPIDRCPVLAPSMAGAIDKAWAIAEALGPLKKPLDIHVTANTERPRYRCARFGSARCTAHASALTRVAAAGRIARITRHGEMVAQIAPPVIAMGKAQVTLPPGPFLQATALGEETLARLVLESAGKAKTALDLFCGDRSVLAAARRTRPRHRDRQRSAGDSTRSRARRKPHPGSKQVTVQKRDLFRLPLSPLELNGFDAVIFDPPRQGAEAQAREIAKSKAKTIVAVSCNAATFARDAAILIGGGYRLMRVTPVDQFKYTAHVEIVAQFVR